MENLKTGSIPNLQGWKNYSVCHLTPHTLEGSNCSVLKLLTSDLFVIHSKNKLTTNNPIIEHQKPLPFL